MYSFIYVIFKISNIFRSFLYACMNMKEGWSAYSCSFGDSRALIAEPPSMQHTFLKFIRKKNLIKEVPLKSPTDFKPIFFYSIFVYF